MPQPSITDYYECRFAKGDEPFPREIVSQAGILLAITHSVDPSADDMKHQFIAALRDGRMLCGWVPLSGK